MDQCFTSRSSGFHGWFLRRETMPKKRVALHSVCVGAHRWYKNSQYACVQFVQHKTLCIMRVEHVKFSHVMHSQNNHVVNICYVHVTCYVKHEHLRSPYLYWLVACMFNDAQFRLPRACLNMFELGSQHIVNLISLGIWVNMYVFVHLFSPRCLCMHQTIFHNNASG